jgi:hemerythrin-like domain-containing protein
MRRITDVLTIEHTLLCILFGEIDRLLPEVRTVDEVRLLSRLVEGVLSHHADVEENLAFAALDHALVEKGELKQLHQDHEEIDARLRGAALATEFNKAVRLLKAGLKASRAHFRREEQSIFPLLEKLFAPGSLETLGAVVSDSASFLGPYGFANALRARLRNAKNSPASQGGLPS